MDAHNEHPTSRPYQTGKPRPRFTQQPDAKPDPSDILQITPATGWYARFRFPEGDRLEPLCCWALQRDGSVVGMITCGGFIDDVSDVQPFDDYVYRPDLVAKAEPNGIVLLPRGDDKNSTVDDAAGYDDNSIDEKPQN